MKHWQKHLVIARSGSDEAICQLPRKIMFHFGLKVGIMPCAEMQKTTPELKLEKVFYFVIAWFS